MPIIDVIMGNEQLGSPKKRRASSRTEMCFILIFENKNKSSLGLFGVATRSCRFNLYYDVVGMGLNLSQLFSIVQTVVSWW